MTENLLMARWATRGGRFWIELFRSADRTTWHYQTDNGGGNLGCVTEAQAMDEMQSHVQAAKQVDGITYRRCGR